MTNFKKVLRQNVWILSAELVVLISYLSVLKTFFQQDEWLSFGYKFLTEGQGIVGALADSFIPSVGHYQPLNTLALYILFWIFKLNHLSYALLSLFLHLVVVYLVFYMFKQFFKDLRIPALIALFFGVNASIFQTTSWLVADIGVHFSTIFALLSLTFFFQFINTSRTKKFVLSLFFLVVSLLFKEITIGLFGVFLLVFYIFSEKKLRVRKIYPIVIVSLGALYVMVRFLMIFIPQSYSRDSLVTQSQSKYNIIFNVLTMPIIGVSQSFIPVKTLVSVSYSIAELLPENVRGQKDTMRYGVFAEKNILELVNVLVFLVILGISYFGWRRNKNSLSSKLIVFGLALILLNSPIFGLAPERTGKIVILDSRNLYFISIGSASLIVTFVLTFFSKKLARSVLFLSIISFNIILLRSELSQIATDGEMRLKILSTISATDLKLPNRVVFYVKSDSSYYGLPIEEKILPFQSGFGQTLLVWYQPTEVFPKSFFEDRFLWEIRDQGYKEDGGRGFGYFRNYDLLKQKVMEYNLPASSVIAFEWNKENSMLTDITKEVRLDITSNLR